MAARKLSASRRGMGWQHQLARQRLLPLAYGRLCPLGCGRIMRPGMPLDLDHVVPRALGGVNGPVRIVCARCNRRKGAKLRHRLAKAATNSRDW